MGRLWQTLILSRWQPLFAYLPVETVIKSRQQAYYGQLGSADKQADCTGFIEFMLDAIETSLNQAIGHQKPSKTPGKTPGKTPVKTPERILALLTAEPGLSIPEMAASLGKSNSAVERAVRKLRESGRLRRVGPDKGGYWEVREPQERTVKQ